ncbi:hypothetical protein J132_02607, partial [Termitomyces sp. J132]
LFAIRAALLKCFSWSHVSTNIACYICTCHLCQIHQITKVFNSLTVSMPAPLFSKIYINTMFMLLFNKFKYITEGHCSLIHYPEFRMLQYENTVAVTKWIFENIICHCGVLFQIVTDNRPPIIKAVAYLTNKYHLNHIHISGYNECANNIVEWPHFDV